MLSSRAKYATRAILHLAVHEADGPVLIQDIADAQNIPLKYLQQILVSLKVAGFVKSRKGPGGGYVLARTPGEIMLGAVLRSMDGPIAPISCVSVTQHSECGCPDPETCALRSAFKDVRAAISAVLDATSFQELADKQRAGTPVPSVLAQALS